VPLKLTTKCGNAKFLRSTRTDRVLRRCLEGVLPLYDYQCTACGHSFELRQSFDSDPKASCPECQGDSRRKFSVVPVIYKGSGFYTTDYKKSSVDATAEDGKSSKQDQKESKDKKNGKKESSAGSGSSSDKNKESTSQESVDSSSTKPKGD